MRCPFLLVLVASWLAAGCQPPAETRQISAEATGVPAPAATGALSPVASLAGEWRVAGIDGRSLDAPVGIALSGSADELWWEPGCAGMVSRYRISGTSIRFDPGRHTAPPPPPAEPPPPVCAIALPPGLHEVMRALHAADTVGRTKANGVLLSGGGYSLLLFSQ